MLCLAYQESELTQIWPRSIQMDWLCVKWSLMWYGSCSARFLFCSFSTQKQLNLTQICHDMIYTSKTPLGRLSSELGEAHLESESLTPSMTFEKSIVTGTLLSSIKFESRWSFFVCTSYGYCAKSKDLQLFNPWEMWMCCWQYGCWQGPSTWQWEAGLWRQKMYWNHYCGVLPS